MANGLELSTIFKAVTQELSSKQSSLNDADTYNQDHGDHMVQIFNLIQGAVAKKSDQPIANQLSYASKVVEKEASSGSAKLYSQGLANAAKNLDGSELNATSINTLVKSLLSVKEPEEKQSGGLLGSLLSGLTGGGDANSGDGKVDMDDLMRAGLAYYQSKQEGESDGEAIMDAIIAASPMGNSADRTQSGSLVASTIMNFAKSFINK